jgi:Rrf2 family protein
VRLSAKADYALRAAIELAANPEAHVKMDRIAAAQEIPIRFLEHILLELKHAQIVESRRGAEGGYRLARPPEELSLADVVRAVEGPLANVRGVRPEVLEYAGSAEPLRDVFVALRASVRTVLEHVTLADVAHGRLPQIVHDLTRDADAWSPR